MGIIRIGLGTDLVREVLLAIGNHMVMGAIKFILVPTQRETLTAIGVPSYWKPFTSISILSCSLSSSSSYSCTAGLMDPHILGLFQSLRQRAQIE